MNLGVWKSNVTVYDRDTKLNILSIKWNKVTNSQISFELILMFLGFQ